PRGQLLQDEPLFRTKTDLSMLAEQLSQFHSGHLADLIICICKVKIQQTCCLPADHRFAAAHETDQDYICFFLYRFFCHIITSKTIYVSAAANMPAHGLQG